MEIQLDRGRILGALEEIWTEWSDWADTLTDPDWATPSRCPGWTVQDNLAHIIGTERMLQGEPAPDVEHPTEHLKNPIAAENEKRIQALRSLSGSEVLDLFRTVSAERLGQLPAMSEEEILKVGWAPVGEVPYLRFMHVRVYDSWLHLEDCRAPLGHEPSIGGVPARMAVDEVTTAAGFVIGKKAGAPEGSRVEVTLTGPVSEVAGWSSKTGHVWSTSSTANRRSLWLCHPTTGWPSRVGGSIQSRWSTTVGSPSAGIWSWRSTWPTTSPLRSDPQRTVVESNHVRTKTANHPRPVGSPSRTG